MFRLHYVRGPARHGRWQRPSGSGYVLAIYLVGLWMTLSPAVAADVAVEKCDLFTARQGGYHTYRIPGIGVDWANSLVIEPGFSGYSDLCVAPDGTGYCLYERGAITSYYDPAAVTVARFDVRQWLSTIARNRGDE